MIRAEIRLSSGGCTIRVCGHSGYSEAGSDIVCASVSSMLMLTVNALNGFPGCKADARVNERDTEVFVTVTGLPECALGLIRAFGSELTALAGQYPANVAVIADM